jgi:Na+/proline symporter
LFPVSFVLAFVVGTGIPSLFGYSEPSLNSTPWWVITLAFAAALLIFAAPLPVTAHFSNKAVADGEQRGRLPLVVAGVAVGAFVVQNLAGGIAQLLS